MLLKINLLRCRFAIWASHSLDVLFNRWSNQNIDAATRHLAASMFWVSQAGRFRALCHQADRVYRDLAGLPAPSEEGPNAV